MSYPDFYNYISPRIVSSIIELFQNNKFTNIKHEKNDQYDNSEYSEYRLETIGKNYSVYLKKEKNKSIKKISIYEIENIATSPNETPVNTYSLMMETLFLDMALIEKLNKEFPSNSLIEQNCIIFDMNKFLTFLVQIDFKYLDEALLIYNKETRKNNKEIVFTINNAFNAFPKFKSGDYRIMDEYYEYSFVEENEYYQISYIINYNQVYFFEKNKNIIKIFKEDSPYRQKDEGFVYIGSTKDPVKKKKALIKNKKYLKSKTPIFEINSKKTINTDLIFFENLMPFISDLYIKNKIEITLPFDQEKLENVLRHIKYLDLNNMYVDFLWNTEAKTKWTKGALGYYLSIDPVFFNFDKLEKPIKLIKNEHTASISSFNSNSNILKTPEKISPEWREFVIKSYKYVLENHRNFKFSHLNDNAIIQVTKHLKKVKIID